jgi:hypothetical protein
MEKYQSFYNIELAESQLTNALTDAVTHCKEKEEAQFVEVHQVIQHNEKHFTAIFNIYKK